jgi:hypothetical protein
MTTNEGERLSRELVQLPLIEVLKQIFEGKPFDATDVWSIRRSTKAIWQRRSGIQDS